MPVQVSAVPSLWTEQEQMLTPSGRLQVLGLCLTDTCSRPGSQSRQTAILRAEPLPREFPGF